MEQDQFLQEYLVSNRSHTNSFKWDLLNERFGNSNLIPLWVADMEFKAPRCVIDALVERAQNGVYGYAILPDSYFEPVIAWNKNRHNADYKIEHFRFVKGGMNGVYWLINAFTEVNDSIAILTPVYYPFHEAIRDNKRNLVPCNLINENGRYTIDFKKFEELVVANDVKMLLQCSPHNPVGRVWNEEELDRLFAICKKHNVLIISDEFHQDIIIGKQKFIPASIVNNGKYCDNLIVLNSASKTFNLAAFCHSHVIIFNELLRQRYDEYVKTVNQMDFNPFSTLATEKAYAYGQEWLEAMLGVIRSNFEYLRSRLNAEVPEVIVTELEGTYLAWIDLRNAMPIDEVHDFIQKDCNLAVDYGEWFSYGDECKGFIRINLATDPKFIHQAVTNIINNLKNRRKS